MWGTGTGMDMDQETLILIRTRGTRIHQPAGFPIPVSNTNLHCEAALTSLVAASKSPAAVEVTPYASQEMLADLYVGLVPSIQDNDSHLPTGIESKGGGSLEALLSCLLGLYRYLIQKIQQRWNKDVHNPRPPFHRLSCATA